MAIPLQNLDTRRWDDIVEEGRALVPRYAPSWSDHNLHDPGITLVELIAWLVEAGIYRLNRVPAAHLRAFVALAGVVPHPARGAQGVVAIKPPGPGPVDVPAGVQLVAIGADGKRVLFSAQHGVHAQPLNLAAVLVQARAEAPPVDKKRLLDETGALSAFGNEDATGASLWLGFDAPVPPGETLRLHFSVAHGGAEERARILVEEAAWRAACARKPLASCPDLDAASPSGESVGSPQPAHETLDHHSVRTVWQYYGSSGWADLDPASGAVRDDTRALTLDGALEFTPPNAMAKHDAGTGQQLYYLRVRITAGDYDAPPKLKGIAVNALAVSQATPIVGAFRIAPGAPVAGVVPPLPGRATLALQFDAEGTITALEFSPASGIGTSLYYFQAPTLVKGGWLIADLSFLITGNGRGLQALRLPEAPVQGGSARLFSIEAGGVREWQERPSFAASTQIDSHFLLDGMSGELSFSDGDSGRVPIDAAPLVASYQATAAAGGNLRPGAITTLAPSLVNWLLLDMPDFVANAAASTIDQLLAADFGTVWQALSTPRYDAARAALGGLDQPWPTDGGAERETLDSAAARAADLIQVPTRAVTATDYETLAKETPGTSIARTRALPGVHPKVPGFQAPGHVTLIIVPDQKRAQPTPGPGLLAAVRRYIERRRIVGTQVTVVGPAYVEVRVNARVKALPSAEVSRVRADVVAALASFLDPLRGGPAYFTRGAGRMSRGVSSPEPGWPFGRDIYRSEVMQVIDEVAGVDHVVRLAIGTDAGNADCGNACVGPTSLVVSGVHEIEVV